ncbi:hypothetical protein J3458_019081 [Metarhizium acridum]|uniref:uncharacterized protein n=1 Tax=Metarhizium acridum TaxID=92637 RepID=UPI001C6B9AAA|nr:hypothetical protein J3458_019081 [Metarhizium acridum]
MQSINGPGMYPRSVVAHKGGNNLSSSRLADAFQLTTPNTANLLLFQLHAWCAAKNTSRNIEMSAGSPTRQAQHLARLRAPHCSMMKSFQMALVISGTKCQFDSHLRHRAISPLNTKAHATYLPGQHIHQPLIDA